MKKTVFIMVSLVAFILSIVSAADQTTAQKKTVNVVSTAHLDTQWRWTIKNTIDEYIPNTFRQNFKLMDLYPDYKFSFEGAYKYMLFKEYHPDEYAKLKKYIDRGQWRVAGSWVDPVDVNVPSFESLVRHALYGNGFFKKEFGKTSRDIFLPDCFGFGYALPSIAAHTGIKSFSTQKLSWGSAYGVPFDIGIWEGVDGSTVVAGLRPGSYGSEIKSDLSRDTLWLGRATRQGDSTGLYDAYMYIGTGDVGGSPDSNTVDWLQKSIKSDGPLTVKSVGSDDLVDIVASNPNAKLKRYKGELLMTRHGVGCYSSQAAMKRWNRKNEQLAGAAEGAGVIASLFGGYSYPREELKDAWIRFLYHQFHDDITGTSIPEAYEYSWNDEILAQNRFAGILENAVEAGVRGLDTWMDDDDQYPIVVFNPLPFEREDIVQVEKLVPTFPQFSVKDQNGKEVPCQSNEKDLMKGTDISFLAHVPALSYSVYKIKKTPGKIESKLSASTSMLENENLTVKINADGDVVSIFDKLAQKELLAEPIQFQLINDKPRQWPAWEVQYEDIIQPPRALVSGPAEIKVLEKGPARAAIEIKRKSENATYTTIISLTAGSSVVRFDCDVNWREKETLLKAAFKFTTPNEKVTYDLGLGTIERGLNHKELYEVPGHQWADMTSESGDYGVAVLNDCKYGWDHPDKQTLRLTLIHTPGVFDNWSWVGDESTQDIGHHRFSFAVYGHKGDWRDAHVPLHAARLNQPLIGFKTLSHPGPLGKSFSLLQVLNGENGKTVPATNVLVNSVKLAENSDEIIVRLRELNGRPAENIQIKFAQPIVSAREVDGIEEPKGNAVVTNGVLTTSFTPYQPKAFAVKLAQGKNKPLVSPICQPIALTYDLDGISTDTDRKDGNFDGLGNTISGDLLPDTIIHLGVPFVIGPKTAGANNIVSCNGQTISIPNGKFNVVYALVTAVGGPTSGEFSNDNRKSKIIVQDYNEKIGQWNNRVVGGKLVEDSSQMAPAYINRQPVAWYGTHRHNAKGENDTYEFTYLYLLKFYLSPISEEQSIKTITLPNNPRIKLLAATAVMTDYHEIYFTRPLYDVDSGSVVKINVSRTAFIDSTVVTLSTPTPNSQLVYSFDNGEYQDYTGPITINKTTKLKATAMVKNQPGQVADIQFTKLIPYDPVIPQSKAPGLLCKYFEGTWQKLPNFDTLKAVKDTLADTVAKPSYARKEDFGLKFEGLIDIPKDGLYEFNLDSDDGSALYVCDSLVINNDGVHGTGEVPGEIALKAGLHPIKVVYFQVKGGQGLALSLKGKNFEKRTIPKEMFSHEIKGKQKGTRGKIK